MSAVSICSDFGAPQNKVWHCFHIYLPWSDGTRCHDLSFLNAEFQTSFFTLLFSSYSVSASRVVSSAYLRLLIFLSAILIPVCDSSSLLFHMMHSVYKLNKQGDNIQPCPSFESVHCSVFSSSCCFLTHIQISQEISNVVLYSHLLKNFPQFVVIHTKVLLRVFIIIWFIYKTLPIKIYNSMLFTLFSRLCSHHHCLILRHFHHS